MNNEIPSLWLVVSGVFFFLGIVVFCVALVLLMRLMKMVEEIKPKLDSLTTRVDGLIVKVDRISDKVEGIADSMKDNVDGVGGSARRILGTIEAFTKGATGKLEMIQPILMGGMAMIRAFQTIQQFRKAAKPNETKTLNKRQG